MLHQRQEEILETIPVTLTMRNDKSNIINFIG